MLRMGLRTKDEVIARYLLKTAEKVRKPSVALQEKRKALENVSLALHRDTHGRKCDRSPSGSQLHGQQICKSATI